MCVKALTSATILSLARTTYCRKTHTKDVLFTGVIQQNRVSLVLTVNSLCLSGHGAWSCTVKAGRGGGGGWRGWN